MTTALKAGWHKNWVDGNSINIKTGYMVIENFICLKISCLSIISKLKVMNMKKLIIFLLAFMFSGLLMAQPIFNLGIKAGINNSKMSLSASEYTSESVVKTHIGAFGRVGWSKMYLQPEVYYSAKGGRVIERDVSPAERASRFDYSTVDVPVLLGAKLLEGGAANLRVMAGPVFCIMTTKKLNAGDLLDRQYYNDHYMGFQYGVGVDFLNFFLDARMEHGGDNLYQQPAEGISGKNRTFMISVGLKIL